MLARVIISVLDTDIRTWLRDGNRTRYRSKGCANALYCCGCLQQPKPCYTAGAPLREAIFCLLWKLYFQGHPARTESEAGPGEEWRSRQANAWKPSKRKGNATTKEDEQNRWRKASKKRERRRVW